MGLLDVLRGRRDLKAPAPDRLFAITTAQVALETALDIKHKGVAGIVFQPIGSADFDGVVKDAEELIRAMGEENDTKLENANDEFGYRWLILRDSDFEDLVVSLNTVSTELQGGGYGDRLLACVFAFEEKGKPLYVIYNFKRGAFYPFVPSGEKSRDSERELRLKSQLENELPFEQDLARWFPLWEIPL
jgi:hypothetical protein